VRVRPPAHTPNLGFHPGDSQRTGVLNKSLFPRTIEFLSNLNAMVLLYKYR
jgi:hypothetical protein